MELKAKPYVRMRSDEFEAQSLNRTTEVLSTIFIATKEPQVFSCINETNLFQPFKATLTSRSRQH